MARPSKFSPEVERKVAEALRAGVSRKTAAQYAGIDESTFIRWMKRYESFASAVIASETNVEIRAAITIRQAFEQGDWRAALEWLKRRRSGDWGDAQRVEVTIREHAERLSAEIGVGADELIREAERIVAGR